MSFQATAFTKTSSVTSSERPTSRLGVASVGLLVALSVAAAAAGLWKLLGLAWFAFAAMAGGIVLGRRATRGGSACRAVPAQWQARQLVWSYGLASGAMIASAALFLVPEAVAYDPSLGGFGLALGVVAGFALHTLGHQLTHTGLPLDHTTTELTAHALTDGGVIGLVYAAMPELGWLLGLAIFSHKGPAGYAAARRLAQRGLPVSRLLLPASAVGLAALPAGLLGLPHVPAVSAVVFGFATGTFLHVAMDFLPRCELGSELSEAAGLAAADHALLDRLRMQAVLSTALGGAAVAVAWALLRS